MNKHVQGTKVRCINAGGNNLTNGKEYVLLSDFEGDKYGTLYIVNDRDEKAYYYAYRFELVETAPAVPKKVSVKGGYLTISYEGVNMTFDTSNEKSRMLVDAVIDAIYGDE